MERYAAYIRTSEGPDQRHNFSIDAQRRTISAWIQQQGGELVEIYIDESLSGRTLDRPAFQLMCRDAQEGKFEALVVHKFDRFARNQQDALAIKSMLRQHYGIRVFSVNEPSIDSDSELGALIEGISEQMSEWYIRNLSTETAKGKRERAMQGFHNSITPYGMEGQQGLLHSHPEEIHGLRLIFELYATGKYGDNDVAQEMNERGYRTKLGKLFSTSAIRTILKNRIYIG